MRGPDAENPVLAGIVGAIRSIPTRTWLILAGIVVGVLGLLTWAAIAALSWLWGLVPTALDSGNRLAGEAITQFERAAPDLSTSLKEQTDQWAPGVTDRVGAWFPGLKDKLSQMAPGLASDPLADVSGTDPGPVARYAGLVRTHFGRTETAVEARYAGRASFEDVRSHYVEGFLAAGYAQTVEEATPDRETHSFTARGETIAFSLARRGAGRVEVGLTAPAFEEPSAP